MKYNELRRNIAQVYKNRMRGIDKYDYDITFEEYLESGLFKKRWIHLWEAKRRRMKYGEWVWLPWTFSREESKVLKHLMDTKQARAKLPIGGSGVEIVE